MARALARNVMGQLAAAFDEVGWKATIKSAAGEVEAQKVSGPDTAHVVSFAAIYNKTDAVCFQAGIGIRIDGVNSVLSDLQGSDEALRLTAYVLVNHISPARAKRPGWCFSPGSDSELFQSVRLAVQEVLDLPEVEVFFSSIGDVYSYIEAIERARWPFVSIHEPYIAALISVGRIADAVRIAERSEREYLDAVTARGISARDSDLAFVRKVQALAH